MVNQRAIEKKLMNKVPMGGGALTIRKSTSGIHVPGGALVHSAGGSLTKGNQGMSLARKLWGGSAIGVTQANQSRAIEQSTMNLAKKVVNGLVPNQPGRINSSAGKAGRVVGKAYKLARKIIGR